MSILLGRRAAAWAPRRPPLPAPHPPAARPVEEARPAWSRQGAPGRTRVDVDGHGEPRRRTRPVARSQSSARRSEVGGRTSVPPSSLGQAPQSSHRSRPAPPAESRLPAPVRPPATSVPARTQRPLLHQRRPFHHHRPHRVPPSPGRSSSSPARPVPLRLPRRPAPSRRSRPPIPPPPRASSAAPPTFPRAPPCLPHAPTPLLPICATAAPPWRSLPGKLRPAAPMLRRAPGMLRSSPGMWRRAPGMLRSFPGMLRRAPGMWRTLAGKWARLAGMLRSLLPVLPLFLPL